MTKTLRPIVILALLAVALAALVLVFRQRPQHVQMGFAQDEESRESERKKVEDLLNN